MLTLLAASTVLVLLKVAANWYLEEFASATIACGALATVLGAVLVVIRKMR